MTKQLDDMWSSKWVLPEHREALIEDDRSLKRKTKPELDEQEILLIDQSIHNAMQSKGTLILTVFGDYEPKTIIGTVYKFDAIFRMVKISLEDPLADNDECVWVHMRDVLKAEVREVEDWDEGDMDWG